MAETDRMPQHRHCYVCGKAHTEEGRFCGGSCKESKKAELKRKKRQLYLIEALAIIMMVAAILYMM
jgi:predicted nucleic acid-binding Zn ribbon protein